MSNGLLIASIYLFALGAVFGSFCNMLVFRIHKHENLWGYSYCDKTAKRLIWKDLIPIFSFIIYRGRCRECGEKLPVKYPIIELSNALLFPFILQVLLALNLGILEMVVVYIFVEVIFIFGAYFFIK